ncbi:c-type cytochrome [Aquimarina rhabdastrellae]
MKSTIKLLALVIIVISAISCKNDRKPNYQFFPNMYESHGYEPYSEHKVFKGGQEAMLPVEGTISRGWMPYEFENNTEGYNLAKDTLKNPLAYNEENLEKGKELYTIYCGICHGAKGKGKGDLVKREKILGVPSYDSREITEGSIYHVMYYGINSMGSYAAQTSEHERWQIVQYVEKLKADLEGRTPRLDSNAPVVAVEEAVHDEAHATEGHAEENHKEEAHH